MDTTMTAAGSNRPPGYPDDLINRALTEGRAQWDLLRDLKLRYAYEGSPSHDGLPTVAGPERACGRGWAGRCANARRPTCRCRCGGSNHGAKPAPKVDRREARLPAFMRQHPTWLELPTDFLLSDRRLDFTAPNGAVSWCRLRVYAVPHGIAFRFVLLASDPGDDVQDAGMSVTNAAEWIAAAALLRYLGQPGSDLTPDWLYVEHYPARGREAREEFEREHFDLVYFTGAPELRRHFGGWAVRLGSPTWRRLTEADVLTLLGGDGV